MSIFGLVLAALAAWGVRSINCTGSDLLWHGVHTSHSRLEAWNLQGMHEQGGSAS
jgi:hypothetical protein